MILITCTNVIEKINGMIFFDIVIDSKSIFDGQSDLSSSEGVTEERECVIIEDEITRNRGRRMKQNTVPDHIEQEGVNLEQGNDSFLRLGDRKEKRGPTSIILFPVGMVAVISIFALHSFLVGIAKIQFDTCIIIYFFLKIKLRNSSYFFYVVYKQIESCIVARIWQILSRKMCMSNDFLNHQRIYLYLQLFPSGQNPCW